MWRSFVKLGTVVRENGILSKDPIIWKFVRSNCCLARITLLQPLDRDLVIMYVCTCSRTYREVPSFGTLRCYISPSVYPLVRAYLHQLKWLGLSAPSCERLPSRQLDPAGIGINMEVWIRYVTSYIRSLRTSFIKSNIKINDCYNNALAMASRCLHTPGNYVLFSPTWVSYHVEDLK
ncbi:hypothetical protein HZH68_016207 [Vespula germanica]|uniref:Uncharacterized protein n=1 Tax=Vespula germanica TaxID=30212 RepID=A0A834MPB1_VESGE|nr:hypothetical protein HZH68_016207 [Vespula germanica]